MSREFIKARGEAANFSGRINKYIATYGEPLNYPVDAAAWTLGVGRSTMWEMIKLGLVKTVKIGRRRLVPREEVHRVRNGRAELPASEAK